MKKIFPILLFISFLGFPNLAISQTAIPGQTVQIKGYKNANNKKIAKKPINAELMLDLPHIKLYRAYIKSTMSSNNGGGFRTNVDVSDTFWYCLRPGEEVASVVSWTFNTQVNKNVIFRKNAAEYFKDNSTLAQKIKDREFKHDDIFTVVYAYNEWKSK